MTVDIATLVLAGGPLLVLLMAVGETIFITGLFVPAGVATSVAAFLASEGSLPVGWVAVAAFSGALLGDNLGFWLGRRYGRSLLEGEGRFAALTRRHELRAREFLEGHPVYSVSFARMVSFVRTLMPWSAGMSALSYRRFVPYDVLGVTGWTAAYLAAGYFAGRSWRLVSGLVGTGWAVLFVVVGLGWWWTARRSSRRSSGSSTIAGAGPPAPGPPTSGPPS